MYRKVWGLSCLLSAKETYLSGNRQVQQDLQPQLRCQQVLSSHAHVDMLPLLYAGDAIEQVDIVKYLGVQMHGTKGLTPAMEYLRKAAKRAMFVLQRCCQQLRIHDPTLKCSCLTLW